MQAAFILFTDGNQPAIPQGRHIQWRGTYVAPSTAGAWSAVNVTWQKELIPGDYAVVGMRVVGATTLAARINSRSNPQWFPGVLVSSGYDTVFPQYSLPGYSGVWQTFPFTQPPTLEICATTPAPGTVYLDIVQINDQSRAR